MLPTFSWIGRSTPPQAKHAAEKAAAGWCGCGRQADGSIALASHEKVGFDPTQWPASHAWLGWPPTVAGRPAGQAWHHGSNDPPHIVGHSRKPSAGLRYRLMVRMAKRPQVVVVVGATTMQRHDMVDFEAPVVWRRHHTTTIPVDDSSRLLLPFPTVRCTHSTIRALARSTTRAAGE